MQANTSLMYLLHCNQDNTTITETFPSQPPTKHQIWFALSAYHPVPLCPLHGQVAEPDWFWRIRGTDEYCPTWNLRQNSRPSVAQPNGLARVCLKCPYLDQHR